MAASKLNNSPTVHFVLLTDTVWLLHQWNLFLGCKQQQLFGPVYMYCWNSQEKGPSKVGWDVERNKTNY